MSTLGADDDADCVEHLWQMQGVTLADDGAHTDYECLRCGASLVIAPGGVFPQAV